MQKEKTIMMLEYEKIFKDASISMYGSAVLPGEYRIYEELPHVISFAVPLPRTIIREIAQQGPTKTYFHHYRTCNAYIDQISFRLTLTICGQGYDALYIPASQSVSDDGLRAIFPHKTAAVLCGLGGIGMNGLLVTPQYGAGVRLGTVVTNAPVRQSVPIQNPCTGCGKCAKACPSGALYGTAWSDEAKGADLLDRKLCSTFMKNSYRAIGRGSVCGICMAVCPVGKHDGSR